MALETRYYDSGAGYTVLVMDPDTSGLTWAEVQELRRADKKAPLPETIYEAPFAYEDAGADKSAYIESCKLEAQRLAEEVFASVTSPSVTLLD